MVIATSLTGLSPTKVSIAEKACNRSALDDFGGVTLVILMGDLQKGGYPQYA
jgi:hypothetical protein